jgi:anti-anti-sigma factor
VAAQRFFIRGDIDLANAPELRVRLEAVVAACDDDLILDCTGLTFIDSAGVAAIVHTQRELESLGYELRVANVDGAAARVLDVLGLTQVLHVNEPVAAHPDLSA